MKTQIFLLLCLCSYLVLINAYHLRKQEDIESKASADSKLKEAGLKKLANDIKNDYISALETQRDLENENKRMVLAIQESELAQNLKNVNEKNELIENQKNEVEDMVNSHKEEMKAQKKQLEKYIADRKKELEDQLEELNKQLYDFEIEEKANCDKELSKLVQTADLEFKKESECLLKQNEDKLNDVIEQGKSKFMELKKSNELKKDKALEIYDSTNEGIRDHFGIDQKEFNQLKRDIYSDPSLIEQPTK